MPESPISTSQTSPKFGDSAFGMDKQFFSGWQLWQKLVFCLACALVVTVLLGCLKLIYTHRKLRKFTKFAEEERQDQDEHKKQTEMLQQQTMGGPNEKTDAAFGIRAIESGVKVEGVWISPSSTPRRGSRNSSVDSSLREKPPQRDLDIDLEKQDFRKGRSRSVSNSTIGTARTHGRAISLDRGTSVHTSRSPSPDDTLIARPPRSRHPPSSYVRFSCNPYLIRQSTSINTLEGLEAIHKASTSIHSQNGDYNTSSSDSSNLSSNSGRDVEAIAASAPNLFASQQPQPRPRPRPRHNSSTDLEMLNKHRTSQAAEVGQLTPRVRREAHPSLDIRYLSRASPAPPSETQADYFSSPSRSRPSSSAGKSPEIPFPSKAETPSLTTRRSSMPDVTPFTQFCQKAPLPNSRPPSSGSGFGGRRDSRNSESISIYETPPSSPIMPASEGAAALSLAPALALPPSVRTSFDVKSDSQILRGHGSGFEILRPGSLNPKPPAPTLTKDSMEKSRTAPPISMHNSMRPQSRPTSSINSGRKLQKKKRRSSVSPSSFDSTGSSGGRGSRMSGMF